MKRAVFLDRYGTVNEEMGYINHLDRFKIFPWTAPAIRKLNEAGIVAVLTTNQGGVARGYFPESLVQEIHAKLQAELACRQARLDAIYYCPHHPEGKEQSYRIRCECRKPSPGMLMRAVGDLDIDLSASFMVSDRYQDLQMAFQAGARGVLLMSGYGKGEHLYQKHTWPRQPDFIADNLLEGVDWILDQIRRRDGVGCL
jgi:D-glycero-D-manno-heptose 1,7-bisphosphate phosphatase